MTNQMTRKETNQPGNKNRAAQGDGDVEKSKERKRPKTDSSISKWRPLTRR